MRWLATIILEGSPMRRYVLVLALWLVPLAHADDWLYLTRPGDTLIGIGQQYLKNPNDWPKIQSANGLALPKRLPANSRIRIPVPLLKVTPAAVEVTHVQGNVRAKGAEGGFKRLAVGDRLVGGETVLTGPRSFAGFRLADGSTLNQQPTSRLVFGRLAAYGKTGMVATELELQSGRLEASASKQIAPAGGFRVSTPVAVAGLRGTAFRLDMAEDGSTLRNEVLAGAVGVTAQGSEVVVAGGQGTLAKAGQPPLPPRPLLPPPEALSLPERITQPPIAFTWRSDPGARAWRVQLAADAAFQGILQEDLVPEPALRWETPLADGRYFLRVRAIDGDGFEGFDRVHPFQVDLRPLPPELAAPASGERSRSNVVEFTWDPAADARGHLFQVSASERFESGLLEDRLGVVSSHRQRLTPGLWHWRVASLDDRGEPHGWSPTRSLRVQPPPEAPTGTARTEGDAAHFGWSPIAGAAHYQLEVDKDAAAASAQVRTIAQEAKASLTLPPGRYRWRVSAVDADGHAGAWSAVQAIVVVPAPATEVHAQVDGAHIQATWQGQAARYRVELAADADFRQVVDRRNVDRRTALLPRPDSGNYWLRVVALAEDGVESPPSAVSVVEVKRQSPWWLLPLLLLPFGT